MEKQYFCLSSFSVGISLLLLLLLVMPSSSIGIEIKVEADRKITKKNNVITVKVENDAKVKDLKEKIMKKMDKKIKEEIVNELNVKELKLTLEYRNSEVVVLNDTDTLDNQGIGEGSTVHLSFDKFEIHVKSEDEKLFKNGLTFWVKKTDTVEALKKQIEKSLKNKPQQTLKYGKFGVLQDKETMEFYGIGEGGATVQVSLEFSIWVNYKKWKEEEKETKEEKKEEKVKEEKKAVESKWLEVWAKKTDTVEILKQIVKKATQIEPKRQTLRRVEFGAILEDNETMAFIIENRSTIYMSIDEFEIHVKDDDYKYKVWVTSLDTVYSLKQNIQYTLKVPSLTKPKAYINIPPEEQTLTKNDGTDGMLNDSETMAFCGIDAGATVQLSWKTRKLWVEFSAKNEWQKNEEQLDNLIVWVKKTDTVATVKKLINDETKFEPKRQTLRRIKFGAKLEDTQIMGPLIHNEETIYLSIDEFQIDVEYENEKYPIWVSGTETLALLKEKLIDAGVPKLPKHTNSFKQTLEYGTFGVLDDRKLLNYYGIGAGATLIYSIGTIRIQVEYKNKKGRHYEIWVRKSDTVKILKQRITNALGFTPKIQSLTYSSHNRKQYPLLGDDTKTMEDHGIINGETVQLGFSEFEICVFNGGKESRIWVQIEDTVKDLKEKIFDMVGIPPKSQKISIAKGGEATRVPQDDEDMLSMVEDGDVVVHVSECPAHQFEIFVQYGHRKKAITVYGTDMVENLKKEINKVIGIVPANQTLTIHTVLEDGKQIDYFGIGPESTIYLSDVESKPRRRN